MSFERLVNALIEDALARGEFDNLAGAGKPIDLSAYFETPEELRPAYALLKNADLLPPEAEWLKEIAHLQEALKKANSDEEKRSLLRKIEELRLAYRLRIERKRFR
ncbi:MAG: DUF1992 domain-containing protein [Anaerolineales bacterium]|nr:DUF1992 domain-containing protein [Anaerolineales bacterium]MCX7609133.1 DUF1992 domain-containing protein [Anaerolineales bacterium]